MEEIKEIKIESPEYPQLLKKIPDAPKTLYLKGSLPKGDFFAIVGTRRCSDYGKQIALTVAGDLAQSGLVIVSGMAKGIDTFCHKGCLLRNGKTVAVLGTGLDEDSIYPRENLKLSRQIVEKGGCLISEYPARTKGLKQNFPQRNRIISGLSLGVLVVEAKIKSGALITARWARKQKRKVFAVPGPIQSLNSQGPHLLIKKGAFITENAADILKYLKLKTLPFKAAKNESQTPQEALITEALKGGPLHVEKIIEKSGLQAKEVCSILAIMEIKGIVINLGANVYTLS